MKFENGTFSSIPSAAPVRPEPAVYVKLSRADLELLRTALMAEYAKAIQQVAALRHTGSSAEAMNLCRRRSEIDSLIERFQGTQNVLTVEPKSKPRVSDVVRARAAGAGRAA